MYGSLFNLMFEALIREYVAMTETDFNRHIWDVPPTEWARGSLVRENYVSTLSIVLTSLEQAWATGNGRIPRRLMF